jgi:hypothetical protein
MFRPPTRNHVVLDDAPESQTIGCNSRSLEFIFQWLAGGEPAQLLTNDCDA